MKNEANNKKHQSNDSQRKIHDRPAGEPNITQALWNKLAINCAINPLTAIHQCLNGKLAAESYRSILDSIIEEVVAVMNAENIPVKQDSLNLNKTHSTETKLTQLKQDSLNLNKTHSP